MLAGTLGLIAVGGTGLSYLATSADAASAPVTAVPALDLFLLIGQSNMSGRAPIERQDRRSVPRAYLLTDDPRGSWIEASNPLSRYSTVERHRAGRLGLGYTFAEALTERLPRRTLGLVVNPRGGTGIDEGAPRGYLLSEAVRRARIAARFGTFRGVLWHEGESSAADPDFLPKLTAIIKYLRGALANPRLPVVAGQLYAGRGAPQERTEFNDRLATLPETVPYTAVVSAEGLSAGDHTHLDSRSQRILGRRFAAAWLNLVSRPSRG